MKLTKPKPDRTVLIRVVDPATNKSKTRTVYEAGLEETFALIEGALQRAARTTSPPEAVGAGR